MQVVYPRCCGLDIHKKTIVACVLLTDTDGTLHRFVRTVGTMTADLLALDDWLSFHAVTHVAMESTGVLWRPVFNVLEEGRTLLLVNAQHIKAVPGHKTDIKDSEWLADLLRHGLLRPSFIPPQPIRVLRDLTRYRKSLVELHTQEINRVHKVLETANIKLGVVASNVVGVSGRRMLQAIERGEDDPEVLAELAKGRLREKLPALRLALTGRVQPHHRLLIGELLDHIEYLERAIQRVEGSIADLLAEQDQAKTGGERNENREPLPLHWIDAALQQNGRCQAETKNCECEPPSCVAQVRASIRPSLLLILALAIVVTLLVVALATRLLGLGDTNAQRCCARRTPDDCQGMARSPPSRRKFVAANHEIADHIFGINRGFELLQFHRGNGFQHVMSRSTFQFEHRGFARKVDLSCATRRKNNGRPI